MLALLHFLFIRSQKNATKRYRGAIFRDVGVKSVETKIRRCLAAAGLNDEIIDDLLNKLYTGRLTASEFLTEVNTECEKLKTQTPDLTSNLQFSVDCLQNLQSAFVAAKELRATGIYVGAVLENWVEDRQEYKNKNAKVLVELNSMFDVVVETSKVHSRDDGSKITNIIANRLHIHPSQAMILNDIDEYTKQAIRLWINSSLVHGADPKPTPCHPDKVPHSYAEVQPGIKLHYVDVGKGPVIMLFHGFPEMWYGWRYQIPALCDAGFRVIAMDQRGYGDSSCPTELSAYLHEELCRDAIGLMNALKIPTCYIFGHAAIIWNLALKYPDRIRAAGCLNTPFLCHEGLQERDKNMHLFSFQFYFQVPGVAERELGSNLKKTINTLLGDYPCEDGYGNVVKQGGVLVKVPDDVRSKYLTEYDVQYYVQQFTKCGFRGPVNYYRGVKQNAMWKKQTPKRKILCPSLMITTGNDKIVLPEFSNGMEKEVPNLTRFHFPQCGHWANIEQPFKFNQILIDWLNKCERDLKE